MFKKESKQEEIKANSDLNETVIGSSVHVEGNLQSKGKIIIRGTVNGSIKTEHDVLLDKDGKVLADINAKNAIIYGEVKGNLHIKEKLEIKATGHIQGNLQTQKLIIEEGGHIEGHCKTGKSDTTIQPPKEIKLAQSPLN